MTATPENTSSDSATTKQELVTEHELDANSLNAIRSILTEEDKPAPRRSMKRAKVAQPEAPREAAPVRSKADAFPPLESPEPPEVEDLRPEKKLLGRFSLRRKPKAAAPKAAPKVKAPAKRAAEPAREQGASSDLLAKVKAYRPKPAHIALAALALFVLLRPWLVLGLVFLFMIIMVGVFLIAGYDGFWQGAIKFGRWYANRNPERAALLHDRLDRFAVKWDAILDRFPEGSVDGLYLPDFGEMATADDRHAQAMDRRLTGLHGNGA